MTERTWKIRDQLPSGKWGPEREVTLAEYRAEMVAKAAQAKAVFAANATPLISGWSPETARRRVGGTFGS